LQLAVGAKLRRPFHEAPAPVRQLLVQDHRFATEHGWLFDVPGPPRLQPRPAAVVPVTRTPPVEHLTAKELEVLVHLDEMLTTEEIATVMYISVNTVRTHVRSILRKLGVSRRNAAVRAAREFELLPT
jgi:LuxR family transcriptional regulator, maltose regulon positive regulatory protein